LTKELLASPECRYFDENEENGHQDLLNAKKEKLPDGAFVTILGMMFHCIADGFAFGASGYRIFIIIA